MTDIDITIEEVQTGRITAEHRKSAVMALEEDGFVVLNDVIDREHIAVLREKMLEDVDQILARKDAPFNFNRGNIQQEPPPFAPYLFRDVLYNEMVIAITHAVFGGGLKNAFYSGNTAVAGSAHRQPVHADTGQLWPNLKAATLPFGLVVNVPVVDMTPENGSTEIWPGTHQDTTVCVQQGDIKLPADVVERRRAVCPPIQPSVRAGSVVIRDIRLWHAGMPNHSAQSRPMIAMIHWIGWWRDHDVLIFPKSEEAFFQHPLLQMSARFTDKPIDYIHHGGAYDFQVEESSERAGV